MIALQILDVKEFTKHLFIGAVFHPFLLNEGTVTTSYTVNIDGTLRKNFYSEEEQADLKLGDRDFSTWEEVKNLCFSIIKGRHTPLYFKFVFQLSRNDIEKFLISSGVPMTADDVFGLFLNITFDGSQLICTTGTSVRTFTLDKTLDNSWDLWIMSFLKNHGIATEKIS